MIIVIDRMFLSSQTETKTFWSFSSFGLFWRPFRHENHAISFYTKAFCDNIKAKTAFVLLLFLHKIAPFQKGPSGRLLVSKECTKIEHENFHYKNYLGPRLHFKA